jgi:hypothetical protein
MDALPVLNCWVTFTLFLTSSQKVPGRGRGSLGVRPGFIVLVFVNVRSSRPGWIYET